MMTMIDTALTVASPTPGHPGKGASSAGGDLFALSMLQIGGGEDEAAVAPGGAAAVLPILATKTAAATPAGAAASTPAGRQTVAAPGMPLLIICIVAFMLFVFLS
jgi:flagellar hook-length control protein FliK